MVVELLTEIGTTNTVAAIAIIAVEKLGNVGTVAKMYGLNGLVKVKTSPFGLILLNSHFLISKLIIGNIPFIRLSYGINDDERALIR